MANKSGNTLGVRRANSNIPNAAKGQQAPSSRKNQTGQQVQPSRRKQQAQPPREGQIGTMRPQTTSRLGDLQKGVLPALEEAFEKMIQEKFVAKKNPEFKKNIIEYCSLLSAFFKIKEFGKDDFVRFNINKPLVDKNTTPLFPETPIGRVYKRFFDYNKRFENFLNLLQGFVEKLLKAIEESNSDRITIGDVTITNETEGIRKFINLAEKLFKESYPGDTKKDGTIENGTIRNGTIGKNRVLFITACLAKKMVFAWTDGLTVDQESINDLGYFDNSKEELKDLKITHKCPPVPASFVNFTQVKGEWPEGIALGGGCITQGVDENIAKGGVGILTNKQLAQIGFPSVFCYTKNGFTTPNKQGDGRTRIKNLPDTIKSACGFNNSVTSCNLATILSADNGIILGDAQQEDLVFVFQYLAMKASDLGMFKIGKEKDENGIDYNFFRSLLGKTPTKKENNDLITRENFIIIFDKIKEKDIDGKVSKDILNKLNELNELKKQLNKERGNKEKSQKELTKIKNELEALKAKKAELEKAKQEAEKAKQEAERERDKFIEENEGLKKEKEEIGDKLKKLEQSVEEGKSAELSRNVYTEKETQTETPEFMAEHEKLKQEVKVLKDEKAKLKKAKQDAEKQIKALKAKLAENQININELKAKIAELKKQLDEGKGNEKKLQEKLAKTKKELEELKAKEAELEKAKLEKAEKDAEKAKQKAKEAKQEAEKAKKYVEEQIKALKAELEKNQTNINELKKQLDEGKGNEEKLREELTEVKNELEELKAKEAVQEAEEAKKYVEEQIKGLKAELEKNQTNINELKKQFNEVKSDKEKLQKELTEVKNKLEALKDEEAEQEAEEEEEAEQEAEEEEEAEQEAEEEKNVNHDGHNGEEEKRNVNFGEEDYSGEEEKRDKLREKNEGLKDLKNDLEAKLEKAKQEAEEQIKGLKAELKKNQTNINESNAKIAKLEEELNKEGGNKEKLQKELTRTKNELEELKAKEAKLEEAKQGVEEEERNVNFEEEDYSGEEEEKRDQLREKNEELKDSKNGLEAKLEKAKQEVEKKIKDLEAKLAQNKEEIDKLNAKIAKLQEELNKEGGNKEKLQEELAEANKKLEELKAKGAELEKTKQDAEEQIKGLEAKLKKLQKDIEDKKEKSKEHQAEIEQLKTRARPIYSPSGASNGIEKYRIYGDSSEEYEEDANRGRRTTSTQTYFPNRQYYSSEYGSVNEKDVVYRRSYIYEPENSPYTQNSVNGQNACVYKQPYFIYEKTSNNGQIPVDGQLNFGDQLSYNLLLNSIVSQTIMSSYMLQSLFLPRQENYKNIGIGVDNLYGGMNIQNPHHFIGRQGGFINPYYYDMYPFYDALSMCLFHRNYGYKISDLPGYTKYLYGENVGFRDLMSNFNKTDCYVLLGNISNFIERNFHTITKEEVPVIEDMVSALKTRVMDLRNREIRFNSLSGRSHDVLQLINLGQAFYDINMNVRIKERAM